MPAAIESAPITAADKLKAVVQAAADIDKEFGKGTFLRMGDRVVVPIESVPTGIYDVDYNVIQAGGFPRGRISEVYGPECVDSQTFIQYSVWDNGTRVNHKGGTIERLYERFHGVRVTDDWRGKNGRTLQTAEYYAPSVNEEGRIVSNKIVNVVKAGQKECLKLTTVSGKTIFASHEHKFLAQDGAGFYYESLGDLRPGSTVFIHNGTPYSCECKKPTVRGYVYVKYHPVAGKKIVADKYEYYRVSKARAVVEAELNRLPLDTFIGRLNDGDVDGLAFLPRHLHVHHKNEDSADDRLANLTVLSSSEHGKLHARERQNNLRFMAIQDEVLQIESVGMREMYDLTMTSPMNNYVADGFVVHNSSGKTTLALSAVAEAQRAGGLAAFIDVEHALDPSWAALQGVDVPNLYISQPDYGEQALQVVERLLDTYAFPIIVVDSVAALVPKAELDGEIGDSHMGLQARLMSQAMRKLNGLVMKSNTALVFINQIRDKIGVMFGSPETTTGGRALKFYASLRLDIRRIGQIKEGDAIVGNKTKIKCAKNKVGAPFRETEVPLLYERGFDKEGSLLTIAADKGIVVKSGAWYQYKGERLGQGHANATAAVREQGLFAELLASVRKVDEA